MRRSPRALVAWSAAVVVALVTARIVATDLATLHRRAATLGPMRAVVVAATDLPLGATVRRADVDVIQMYASTISRGALHDRGEAVGKVVAVPVLRGATLVRGHLAGARRSGLDGLVAEGHRAIRVVTDDGLRPRPGDVVDVLVSFDPTVVVQSGGGKGAVTVANAARVLAFDGGGEIGATKGPGVTLLVTEQEAHAVAFAVANGALMLALAPPEAACCTDPTTDARSRP
ncbi:MAG: Flp pilus assembly protein RcpC/CpaB [Actinomycetota bacterium]|nr:Flp pilus assembly protein RcpC/CpaB [Actinomycetota bacterium]